MSKQQAIAAFETVERRVAARDCYTHDGRQMRIITCFQLAYELKKGSFASFQRCWSRMQQGQHWEAAEDALAEVFDELGLTDIDHLYRFVTTA